MRALKVEPRKETASIHPKNKEKKAVDMSINAKKILFVLNPVFIFGMIILYVIDLDCLKDYTLPQWKYQ